MIWRDPYGAHYLIDPTGTRRVTPTTGDETPTRTDIMVTELLLNHAVA
ncbi:hypothetical protein [Nocardioides sp. L-11A]|nr:hypothetical protein QJ852_15890 [Nocardioides sp. L-11A]